MRKVILFFLLLQSSVGFSQATTYDPYSNYGIGEEGSLGDAQFMAIGNVKSSYIDTTVVNFYNPSSYSFLGKGMPLTSVNITGRLTRVAQNDLSKTYSIANLTHIALAFPVTKRGGFAFGLSPFSRKGYLLSDTRYEDGDSILYAYRGVGTTQRVFVGGSFQLIRSERQILAVGANLGYIFGSVGDERYAKYQSLSYSGLDETVYRMKSFHSDFGITYRAALDTNHNNWLTIGVTCSPEQTLTAEKDYGLYYLKGSMFERDSIADTIIYNPDMKGTIKYPTKLNFGVGYTFRPRNANGNLKQIFELGVYAEYSSTNWSDYKEDFADGHTSPGFYDSRRFSVGFTYRPNIDYANKSAGSKTLSRFQYKLGFYNQSLPTVTTIAQMSETAITGGLSVPLTVLRNSSFNFGFAAGFRSNGTTTAVSEQFLSLSLGIVISPSKYDAWFRRNKID